MESDPLFEWRVPAEGFRVDRGRLVRARADEALSRPPRVYRPLLETPALFRTFADLSAPFDERAAVAFANEYGALGIEERGQRETPEGEALGGWKRELTALQEAVRLMDVLANEAGTILRPAGGEPKRDRTRLLLEARLSIDRVPRLRRNSVGYRRLELQVLLADLIEPQLEQRVRVAYRLIASETPALVLQPRTLLGALWLQLAVAVSDGRAYRRCAGCGKWLDISTAVGRVDRRYCDTACRMRAYRARREAAT